MIEALLHGGTALRIGLVYRDFHERAGLPRFCVELARSLSRTDDVFLFSRRIGATIPAKRIVRFPWSFRSMRIEYGPNTVVNSSLVGVGKRVLGLDVVNTQGAEMLGFDVITAHGTWPAYLRACASVQPDLSAELRKSVMPLVERANYRTRRYKRIIAVSEMTRRELRAIYGVPDEDIEVIPEGVDLQRFRPDPIRRSAWRKRMGFEGRFVLLHVTTDFSWKGLRTILRALPGIEGDPHLVVVGPGDPAPYLAEMDPEAKSRVTFFKFQENIEDFYSGADLFLFPSRRESFGLCLLEAMASALPVICTKDLGAAELMTDGKDALLLDRWDSPEELIDKANAIGPTGGMKIGVAARQSAEMYSWERMANRTRTVYEACLPR